MNYYNEIKNELINNEISRKVKNYSINKNDLDTYYSVGKILSEAGKHYGDYIIKEYSERLTEELGKGYTVSNLKRFRQFFNLIGKGATLSHQLSWSHYSELIPLNNTDEINYYIKISIDQSLSVRNLRNRIKSREYERLDKETKRKLINNEENNIMEFVKNPILIKNKHDYENISEKILQKLILEDIESFMRELGNGISFIASEYKIKLGDKYNYIDILLFNIEFNCYLVVELKTHELRKESIGQIEIYMNYIDKNIKKNNQANTVGIIICKKDNKYIIEYCSDRRIISREYMLI